MPNSIHTAKWLSQFDNNIKYEIHFYPCYSAQLHKYILNSKNIILHEGDLEMVIDMVKPDIIHTLEMQHSAYLLLPIREKRKEFPLWFYSCWGSDIKWFRHFPNDKKNIVKILGYIDALFSGDKQSIKIVVNDFGFSKKILNVPSPGGIKIGEINKYLKNIKVTSKRKIILVKGYTGWVYKPETIFKALEKCSNLIKEKKYNIVIYLPGEVDKYIERLTKLGICVTKFLHTNNQLKVFKLFSKSRINLAASLSDGIPNSMIESMLVGSFPIQSIFFGSEEYISNCQNGIVLDPLDVEGYVKAIKLTLNDNNLVDSAAKYNKLLISNKYDYFNIKKKVLFFYNSFFKSSFFSKLKKFVIQSFKFKKISDTIN